MKERVAKHQARTRSAARASLCTAWSTLSSIPGRFCCTGPCGGPFCLAVECCLLLLCACACLQPIGGRRRRQRKEESALTSSPACLCGRLVLWGLGRALRIIACAMS